MQTLSLTVLLLFAVFSCNAMPHAMNAMAPGPCCFQFLTKRIPQSKIICVTKTHSSCHQKGFVISTVQGKEICVSQKEDWAQKAFRLRQATGC
ncbi:hypothetical protein PBY51_012485 [Eleginops maclovinus]|uniref:Chemokine interleukin-8-like domain-containing protein n=1 Tax=Eleginops maclovinus TaxID=56733 RepID=A0AAN7XQQ1_ELEMC|nr:hypothetical protein PBY51_012485 [Eleginops maclovinus]